MAARIASAACLGSTSVLGGPAAGGARSGIDPVAPAAPTVPSIGLTFGDVAELYIEGHVRTAARKIDAQRVMEYHIDALKRAQIPAGNATQIALHAKPIAAIMKSDVEHIRREWIAHRPGSKQGRGRAKPTVGPLRHLFRWAITEGHVDRTPFSLHGVPVIKLDGKVETPRTRRLEGDEDDRLPAHAEPHLRDLIIRCATGWAMRTSPRPADICRRPG